MGVAVQSHWFSVGSVVSWARPGVGAVATQSIGEPSYGPNLLDLLEEGVAPSDALARLTADDERARFRQVAVVDAQGRVAVHTGDSCIAFAGDRTGDGYSVQANMMASPEVWPAMARGFEAAEGPLARRLVAALRAAEAAGGDVRGRQSAATVAAPAEGEPWRLTTDLRVEDDSEPLDELERLLDVADAYRLPTHGGNLLRRRLRARAGGRHPRRPRQPRRGGSPLHARRRARSGQPRADLLGGPVGRRGRRHDDRPRARAPRDRDAAGMGRAARAPAARHRAECSRGAGCAARSRLKPAQFPDDGPVVRPSSLVNTG